LGNSGLSIKNIKFQLWSNLTLIFLLIFIISNKEKSDLQKLFFYSQFYMVIAQNHQYFPVLWFLHKFTGFLPCCNYIFSTCLTCFIFLTSILANWLLTCFFFLTRNSDPQLYL